MGRVDGECGRRVASFPGSPAWENLGRRLRGEGKEGGGRKEERGGRRGREEAKRRGEERKREEGGGSKKGGKGNCTLTEF